MTTTYTEKLAEYMNIIVNSKYIFEVTKCCGYSEFVAEFKSATLRDLHKSVHAQFFHNDYLELYVTNINEKLIIPNDDTLLNTFINNNWDFFRPLYPIPAAVVYKISFNDSCSHDNNINDENV